MEFLTCLETRRSVRRFKSDPVPDGDIRLLVSRAAWAPSWKNTQTARYIAARGELKSFIAENCVMGFAGNRAIIDSCPVLLALATVTGRAGFERDGAFSTSQGEHWQSFDAGIAAQSLCLAAHDMGLATVIMGIFDERGVAAALELPEGERVSALIALGYADMEPKAPPRMSADELLTIK